MTTTVSQRLPLPAVVKVDQNAAPEKHTTDASKSRRKVPRSQLRKVVRTNTPNLTKPSVCTEAMSREVAKPETMLRETSFQATKCLEQQIQNVTVQDLRSLKTCSVLATFPSNGTVESVTVESETVESETGSMNATCETTVCYFVQLLQ